MRNYRLQAYASGTSRVCDVGQGHAFVPASHFTAAWPSAYSAAQRLPKLMCPYVSHVLL